MPKASRHAQGHIIDPLGQSKIGQPDLAGRIEDQVRRFHVAVDHITLMGMGQGLGGLQRPAGRLDKIQRDSLLLRLLQHGSQAAALDELHGIVEHALLLADGEDRYDVRVVQLGDRLGLALEPFHGILVGNACEAEDFEGHFPLERELLGFIDHAHPAPADLADDLKVAES